jgi:hypothetical protein
MPERQVLQRALSAYALAGPQGELRGGGGGGERRRREYGAGSRPCGHTGGRDATPGGTERRCGGGATVGGHGREPGGAGCE